MGGVDHRPRPVELLRRPDRRPRSRPPTRRQHVMPEPNPSSCGRYSHWIPVCSTNKIAHSACRSGNLGRPATNFGPGTADTRCDAGSYTAQRLCTTGGEALVPRPSQHSRVLTYRRRPHCSPPPCECPSRARQDAQVREPPHVGTRTLAGHTEPPAGARQPPRAAAGIFFASAGSPGANGGGGPALRGVGLSATPRRQVGRPLPARAAPIEGMGQSPSTIEGRPAGTDEGTDRQ